MKKLLLILAVITGMAFALLAASVTFTDFEKVYQEFAESTRVDISAVKKSNVKIEKYPIPHLIIEEISQEGKLELKNIEIKFSPISLLTFSPKVTDVTIGEAIIHLDHDDVSFLKHDEFISELIAKNMLSVQAKINRLKFVESDNDVPLIIDNFEFHSTGEVTNFSGVVDMVGALQGAFKKVNDQVSFNLEVQDKHYNFRLNEEYKNGLLGSGKLDIKTTDLANKIVKLIPDSGAVADFLKSSEEVNISCDIKPVKDGIALEAITINSNSLQGKGEAKLSKNVTDLTKIKFEFDKIDLDSWRKSTLEDSSANNFRYGVSNRLDFSKSNITADFFVKELKFNDNNILRDIKLTANVEDSKMRLQDLSGLISNGGQFKVNGVITQNSFRSIFDGSIVLSHKDLNDLAESLGGKEVRTTKPIPFTLSSDVKFSSVDLSLKNLLLKTYETEVTGNLSSKFIGNTPRTNANIKFTSVNIDQGSFPALTQAFAYAKSLFEGMKEESYLGKFIPIRKLGSINNYDITFDRITINGKLYENVNFGLELAPGRVAVDQLYVSNDKGWIDTSFTLEAQGIRPNFAITIHNGSLSAPFLSAPGMLELKKIILDNFDLSKIDVSISGALKDLYQDDFAFRRVVFALRNDKNLLNIAKFDADLFKGRLQSSGSILLEPYTLNFVYALNSARVSEIARVLPEGALSSGGAISISGMWSTNGEKLDEQLYNLYIKSDVVAKDIVLGDFSLDEYIQELGNPTYNVNYFNDDLNKMLLTGQTQISDLTTGVELSKGVVTLQPLTFKTKYSTGTGSATFNLYDFSIDASSVFSFYVAKPKYGRSVTDYAPIKMTITAKGNFFTPKKEADTKKLVDFLKTRNQR